MCFKGNIRRVLTPAFTSALVLSCCRAVGPSCFRAVVLSRVQASDASSVADSGAVDTSEGALESDFQKRMDDSWVRIRRLCKRDV